MASRSIVSSAWAARLSCSSAAFSPLSVFHSHIAETRSRQNRSQHLIFSRASRLFSSNPSKATVQGVDDKHNSRSVQDLLSLKGKTTVITGGGRGIGLALTRACVEAGGHVAVLDALSEPHKDFADLKQDFPASKIEYYKYVYFTLQGDAGSASRSNANLQD